MLIKIYDDLKRQLETLQSPARFQHSLSVATLAAELGAKHGWAPEEARLAGFLHDWAKEWSPRRLASYVTRFKLKIPSLDFILATSPNVLHGFVSADVARRKKWICDPRALCAIASHTLGNTTMTLEDKILYVADLASYDRRFPEAPVVRSDAFDNIHKGFASAIAVKMSYQLRKRKPLHPLVIKVWNRVVCGQRC